MKTSFNIAVLILILFVCQSFASIFGYFSPELSPSIDKWVTKTHTIQNFMSGWSGDSNIMNNLFTSMSRTWHEYSHVPLITWMPYAWRNWTSPNPNDIIANGGYDDYLREFGIKLKKFLAGPDGIYGNKDDRRAYIRFAHQMNGNWFPWAPNCAWSCEQTGQHISQSSHSYVNMWKHVVDLFDDMGFYNASRLQFIWTVNNINFQKPIEEFYPGDYYVGWIGVDGYNFGDTVPNHDWEPATTVFKNVFGLLRNISKEKPVAITEFGSVTSPKGIDDKVQWITDSFEIFKKNDVKMILSFNVDGGKTDLSVFGGPKGDEIFQFSWNAYSSYRRALQDDWIIGTNSMNPRLISDDVFMFGEEKLF